jgi:hypothetical protein
MDNLYSRFSPASVIFITLIFVGMTLISYDDIAVNHLASAQPLSPFNQVPLLLHGTTSNGFVSYLCADSGIQTPIPSVLSFQSSFSPIFDRGIIIPSTGSFALYSSFGIPSIAGQIRTGQMTGNSFTLQGTLTTTLAGAGIGSFCTTTSSSFPFPSISNRFTITGTCGTNVPLAFSIDRNIIGAYIENVACNNAVL